MVEQKQTTDTAQRNAWIAIAVFGVLVLYMAGLLSSHLRNGAGTFDQPGSSFMQSVVAFPVKSLGVWATYLLLIALASQALYLWLGKSMGNVPRRTIGLILLVLGFSGFLGVASELSDGGTHAAWGGGYGVSLADFFMILGGPIAFILSMGLFAFGIFLGRDWFGFEHLRTILGKAPEEAFGLGMPATADIETGQPVGADDEAALKMAATPDETPAMIESAVPADVDPLRVDASQWSEPGEVRDLSAIDVSSPLDDPMADPWAEIESEPNTPISGKVELDEDPEGASPSLEVNVHLDSEETGEVPTLELASIEANDTDTDLMFAEEANPDAAAESAMVTPLLSIVKAPADSMEMAESFQEELPFDAEPPILYKSEPQEAVATEPEAEAEMEAEATEVETEPVPDEIVAEDPATESPSRPITAAGQPPRSGGDDWASWMTEETPAERTQGIAKPSYPQSAAFTGGSLSTVEPEGMEGYHGAVAVVLERDQCSVSLLQRELGISFAAAAAAVEQMEKDRIVGPYQGSGHREVLLTAEAWRARLR